MNIIKGNLMNAFKDGHEVVAHVCNCQQSFGSGVARAIRDTWPDAYRADCQFLAKPEDKMGQVVEAKIPEGIVMNCYAQLHYGKGHRHLRYDALINCLEKVRNSMVVQNLDKLAIPFKMGADRAGGNWEIIRVMFDETFKGTKIEVTAYDIS